MSSHNWMSKDTTTQITWLQHHEKHPITLFDESFRPLREKNAQLMMEGVVVGEGKKEDTGGRCKTKTGKSGHVPHREKAPQLVAKRNARERRRVQAVNGAFVRLRKAVPLENARGKRISKVKTLQYAIDYIQRLQSLLLNTYTTSASQRIDDFTMNYFPIDTDGNEECLIQAENDQFHARY